MPKELEYHLAHLLPRLLQLGIEITEQHEISYGVQLRLRKDGHQNVLNIYFSAKRGISSVIGGSASPLKNLLLSLAETQLEINLDTTAYHTWNSWIGSDECGKGDFFGAPVVCAFSYDHSLDKHFQVLRITDSKLLRDSEIAKIAKLLYKHYPSRISCLVLKPTRYNELIDSFKNQHKNLNDLLTWLHGTAIQNLLKNNPGTEGILVDQFSPSQKVRHYLKEKNCPIPCIERTKAETDPAVAAASIVARYQFLESFESMRRFYRLDFPLGATSNVIEAAVNFAEQYGFSRLGEVAKLHFKTTEQVKARLKI
ncbi:MAG TPA: ribonuclease HIII [Candidatus Cloacimonas sp.]|nr:ribonuclease HIII [Candidatus Cloacimonas sp.]